MLSPRGVQEIVDGRVIWSGALLSKPASTAASMSSGSSPVSVRGSRVDTVLEFVLSGVLTWQSSTVVRSFSLLISVACVRVEIENRSRSIRQWM